MRIAREEIFVPVLTVIPFETEEQALQVASGTPYGLTAISGPTDDVTRAFRFTDGRA